MQINLNKPNLFLCKSQNDLHENKVDCYRWVQNIYDIYRHRTASAKSAKICEKHSEFQRICRAEINF